MCSSIYSAENQNIKLNNILDTSSTQKPAATTQLYKLRGKLKIKDSFKNSYWQEREQVNWDDEVKNWKFGFLRDEDSLPPMVLFKDNFSPTESENIFWVHNRATLLVINPLDKTIFTRLIFFATTNGKDRILQIYVNGQLKEKIVISSNMYKERFKEIIIEDILLFPGKNEILFYGSGKNDIKKNKGKFNKTKNLLVQLKDDIRFETKLLNTADFTTLSSMVDYRAETEYLDIFVFPERKKDNNLFLMSRNLDIDLAEYPYFDFNYEVKNIYKKLDIFLSIDFNNDGKVDGYLNPQSLIGINLFELASNKWVNDPQHYYPSFKVKYIIALSSGLAKDDDIAENTADFLQNCYYTLRINNFRFYSNKSIIIPAGYCTVKDFKVNCCRGETCKKVIANYFIDIRALIVQTYFHNNEEEKLTDKYSSHTLESTELTDECVELNIPINIVAPNHRRNTYLTFSYKLQDFDLQEIDVFLGLDNDGDGNIDEKKPVPEEEFTNLFREDIFQRKEINLTNFNSDIQAIKEIIFKLHKKNKSNEIIEEGWYGFWIADNIEIFSKYPSSIRDETLRNNFLEELTILDFPLLRIDHQEIKFSQINNKVWDIFEDKEVDIGNIKLPSGKHTVNVLENDTFRTKWIFLEALGEKDATKPVIPGPEIIFKKINQTKYIVQVKGAREPFWLFFTESFHSQWKISIADRSETEHWEVIKDYEDLGVKEARYQLNCSPWDFKYLFTKPLAAEHFFANFYANSWYIDPKKLNLSQNFTLVLYFWPQYLFDIGIIIAGAALIFGISYILFTSIRAYVKKI